VSQRSKEGDRGEAAAKTTHIPGENPLIGLQVGSSALVMRKRSATGSHVERRRESVTYEHDLSGPVVGGGEGHHGGRSRTGVGAADEEKSGKGPPSAK
jgi:hypothetical protein